MLLIHGHYSTDSVNGDGGGGSKGTAKGTLKGEVQPNLLWLYVSSGSQEWFVLHS